MPIATRCTYAWPTRRTRAARRRLAIPTCARTASWRSRRPAPPTRSTRATASSPRTPTSRSAALRAGITWIGPPADVIRRMGDKVVARRSMQEAGVPVVPGATERLADARGRGRRAADRLPADGEGDAAAAAVAACAPCTSAGELRGGAGARAQRGGRELRRRRRVRGEADPGARHVEVQLLADAHGNVVHLFERDCSAQRRHQKLIEEAPAPGLSPELRERLGAAALSAARAVGYVSAGTVEFLLAPDGRVLLPRDEHAHPGRASRHRGGDGDRSRAGHASHRGGRDARPAPAGPRARAVMRSRRASTRRIRRAASCPRRAALGVSRADRPGPARGRGRRGGRRGERPLRRAAREARGVGETRDVALARLDAALGRASRWPGVRTSIPFQRWLLRQDGLSRRRRRRRLRRAELAEGGRRAARSVPASGRRGGGALARSLDQPGGPAGGGHRAPEGRRRAASRATCSRSRARGSPHEPPRPARHRPRLRRRRRHRAGAAAGCPELRLVAVTTVGGDVRGRALGRGAAARSRRPHARSTCAPARATHWCAAIASCGARSRRRATRRRPTRGSRTSRRPSASCARRARRPASS